MATLAAWHLPSQGPLVVGERGIAWVVGYRIAHWARVTSETKRVVRLQFQESEPSSA